jgi:hypothetical protein
MVALHMKSQPPSAEGSLLHLLLAFFFVWPDLLSSCFAYEFPGTARNGARGQLKRKSHVMWEIRHKEFQGIFEEFGRIL